MVVSVNSRGTLTLPSDIRKKLNIKEGDHFQIDIKSGKIIITPVFLIPKNQLSDKGKLKEKEASKNIKEKKIKTFKTVRGLFRELNED
jgi:antitoxin MazE